jgi:hypothetical protein
MCRLLMMPLTQLPHHNLAGPRESFLKAALPRACPGPAIFSSSLFTRGTRQERVGCWLLHLLALALEGLESAGAHVSAPVCAYGWSGRRLREGEGR